MAVKKLKPYEVLAAPMETNDADAATVGEYFKALLRMVWVEGESFSGKRPFGNSGWESDVTDALKAAGASSDDIDELVQDAIEAMHP